MPCLQQQLQIHSCQKSILDDSISFTKRNKTCSFQVVLIFLVKLGPLTSNNGFVQRYFFYLFHAPFGIRYPPLERQARAQTTMICPYWGFIPRYFLYSFHVPFGIRCPDLLSGTQERRPLCYAVPR